jgi:hypothetical protein
MKTNHREKSNESITVETRFFSRSSRACWHATSPLCRPPHRGSAANWQSEAKLPNSTARTYRKGGNSMTRAIYYSCLWCSAEKDTTPLTNHREVAKNKHHSCHNSSATSKPSRWRQPPRETRIPQPMLIQVPTKCKLTSTCIWDHSISLWFVNQARKMNRREYAQLKRMLGYQNFQESSPKAGQ